MSEPRSVDGQCALREAAPDLRAKGRRSSEGRRCRRRDVGVGMWSVGSDAMPPGVRADAEIARRCEF